MYEIMTKLKSMIENIENKINVGIYYTDPLNENWHSEDKFNIITIIESSYAENFENLGNYRKHIYNISINICLPIMGSIISEDIFSMIITFSNTITSMLRNNATLDGLVNYNEIHPIDSVCVENLGDNMTNACTRKIEVSFIKYEVV